MDSPKEVTIAECPAALVSAQGMQSQGLTAQGISYQGVSVQGLSMNGMWRQGMTAQGFNIQGMQAQGLQAQGITAQGFSAQGMQGQGLTPQGVQVQGVSAQGFSPQGISAQGFNIQGVTVQGISPDGSLRGLALYGVTPEEATSWVEGRERTLDPSKVVFIGVDRGVLSGLTARGQALEGEALVGLLLPFMTSKGKPVWISLTGVSSHPDARDLPLYALAVDGEALCADPAGGMFVPGIWDETGARHDSVATGERSVDTTFSCTAGVIAKCVAWGYRPWSVGADMHQACTRMARADYCGNGIPHTQNGTLIDLFDTRGIQTPVADDGMSFEAGWGVDGAVCVRETRYVDVASSGERILPSCWNELLHCETFEEATGLGAELGNNSSHTPRSFDCSL